MRKTLLLIAALLLSLTSFAQTTEKVVIDLTATFPLGQLSKTYTQDGITFSFGQNTSSRYATASGTKTTAVQFFLGCTMTMSVETGSIKNVAFGITRASGGFSTKVGTISALANNAQTWTGDAKSVTFEASKSLVVSSMTVTLEKPAAAKPLTYAWTPADSSVTDAPEDIKLWLSSADSISYTGVKFSYVNSNDAQKSVTVDKANITETADGKGGVTLSIPAPTDLKNNKALNVKVSLDGQKSLDEVERPTITASYNLATLKIIAPVIGESVDTLRATDSIKVQLPAALEDRIGVVYYQIVNATTGEIENEDYMDSESSLDNGVWGTDFIQDQIFLAGNQYYISAKAYCKDQQIYSKTPVAADSTALFAGASKSYEYSTVNFVSLTPDPDTYVVEKAEDAVVTIEFDGEVNINSTIAFINTGFGGSEAFDAITPADGDAEAKYAKKWTLSFENFAKKNDGKGIQLSIAAEDAQGRRVKGNAGLEVTSYFDYTYECSIGTPRVAFVPASGSKVDSLRTFIVKATDINESYNVERAKLALYNADNEVVAYAEDIVPFIPESQQGNYDYNPDSVQVVLNTTVTAPGTYTLRIPKQFFNFGTQMDVVSSIAEEATYIIEKKTPTSILGILTEQNRKEQVFTLEGKKAAQPTKGLYIIGGKKVVVK